MTPSLHQQLTAILSQLDSIRAQLAQVSEAVVEARNSNEGLDEWRFR